MPPDAALGRLWGQNDPRAATKVDLPFRIHGEHVRNPLLSCTRTRAVTVTHTGKKFADLAWERRGGAMFVAVTVARVGPCGP